MIASSIHGGQFDVRNTIAVTLAILLLTISPSWAWAANDAAQKYPPTIVFMTDFGVLDDSVAICRGVMYGILNSTTNVILSQMEQGLSFDEALKKAQELGVAETDATHDIDGWDAAVKTAALITVLMDTPVRLDQIAREGIRELTPQAVRNAKRDGWPFKLVCRARRTENGIEATVKPEKILSTQPMAKIANTSSYIYFETDIFPGLAITEENPGLYATAYGLLADFVRAVGIINL